MLPQAMPRPARRASFRPSLGLSLIIALALALVACDSEEGSADADAGGLEGIQPTLPSIQAELFDVSCNNGSCHDDGGPAADLALTEDLAYDALVEVEAFEIAGRKRVVPGDPDASLLYEVLGGPVGPVRQMPPGGSVTDEQREAVRAWIADGANEG